MSDNKCPTCGAPIGGPSFVRLPRPQHEALMAAAMPVFRHAAYIEKTLLPDDTPVEIKILMGTLREIIANARTVGIDLEEKHD